MAKIKNQTWRLIYPDKTESLMNYDPIKYERERIIKILKEAKIKDIWGHEIFKGDWEGLINKIKETSQKFPEEEK